MSEQSENRARKRKRGSIEVPDQVHLHPNVRRSTHHLAEASFHENNDSDDDIVETSYHETIVSDDDIVEISRVNHRIPAPCRECDFCTEFKLLSSILSVEINREHTSEHGIERGSRNILDELYPLEESDSDLALGDISLERSREESIPASVGGDEAARICSGFDDYKDEEDSTDNELSDEFVALLRSRGSNLRDFTAQVVKDFQTQLRQSLGKTKIFDRTKYEDYVEVLVSAGKRRPLPEQLSSLQRNAEAQRRHRIRLSFALNDDKVLCHSNRKEVLVPVATVLNTFGAIAEAHSRRLHAKVFVTHAAVAKRLYGVPEQLVAWLLARCSVCMKNTKQVLRLPLESIVSSKVGEHMQVDLMDFSTKPSGPYKWIMHLKDHYSKMSFLWALKSKESDKIAKRLTQYFEAGNKIGVLHSDNRREFKGAAVLLAQKHGVGLVYGRSYHPQCQGLVKRGNRTVKRRIADWEASSGRSDWHMILVKVMEAINYSPCHGLPGKLTPHDVFFGREPLDVRAEQELPLSPALLALNAEDIVDATNGRNDRALALIEAHWSSRADAVSSESEYDEPPVVPVFEEGEFCFVAFPKNLTIATRDKTFMAKVLSCKNNLYEVLLKWGPLNYRVPVADMSAPFKSNIPEIREYLSDAPNEPQQTIRFIAKKSCTSNMRSVRCSCVQKCLPNRCACSKAGVLCTQYCKHCIDKNCDTSLSG